MKVSGVAFAGVPLSKSDRCTFSLCVLAVQRVWHRSQNEAVELQYGEGRRILVVLRADRRVS